MPVSPSISGGVLAAERQRVGLQGDAEPAQVADVLADCGGAVDLVLLRQPLRREGAVLLDERRRALLEGGAVGIRPPVLESCRRRRTGCPGRRSRGRSRGR